MSDNIQSSVDNLATAIGNCVNLGEFTDEQLDVLYALFKKLGVSKSYKTWWDIMFERARKKIKKKLKIVCISRNPCK